MRNNWLRHPIRTAWRVFQDWKDPFEAYKRKAFFERQMRKTRAFAMLYGQPSSKEVRQITVDYINTGSWWSSEV